MFTGALTLAAPPNILEMTVFHLFARSVLAATLLTTPAVLPAAAQPLAPAAQQSSSRPVTPAEAVARQYIAAYSAADWDAMAPFMAEDFVLVDRTSPEFGGQEFRGSEAVLAMLRDFGESSRIIGLFLDFPVVFESGGIVVFTGHVNTLSRTPEEGVGQQWRAEQVTILTIRDGKVARHEDFANYSAPVITREPLM
jgi:ketosteroid isomerase-like protein